MCGTFEASIASDVYSPTMFVEPSAISRVHTPPEERLAYFRFPSSSS
jgi:hypothetical protein